MGCGPSSEKQAPYQTGLSYQTSQTETSENVKVFKVPVYREGERPLGLGMKVGSFNTLSGARVTHIMDGGAAQSAGLKEGDVIVDIDGRDVLNATHQVVLSYLKTVNESVTITIVPPEHKSLVEPTEIMTEEVQRITKSMRRSNASERSRQESIPRQKLSQSSNASTAILSAKLHRPETSGWHVRKEGFLFKSKRATGFKKTTTKRYFVLKVEPFSKQAELEYYDGMTLKGSMTLQGAKVKPGLGGSFTLHAVDRTWYLKPADGTTSIAISLSWMESLQIAIDKKETVRQRSRSNTLEAIGDGPIVDDTPPNARHSLANELFVVEQRTDDEWAAADGPIFYACPEGPVIPESESSGTKPYSTSNLPRTQLLKVQRPWDVPLDSYNPPTWDDPAPAVGNTNKDNSDGLFDSTLQGICFNHQNSRGVDRRSRMGAYTVDLISGFPYNPAGRTGFRGRGAFPRFGPNHVGGVLLGRNTSDGNVEFLVYKKENGEEGFAIPFVERAPLEHVLSTIGHMLHHHICVNTAKEGESDDRETWVRTCLLQGIEAYAGYLTDKRNTDNAWAEMTCFTIFDSTGELFANRCFTDRTQWVEYAEAEFLNPNHKPIIEAAVALHAPVVRRRQSSAFASAARHRLSSMRYPSEEDVFEKSKPKPTDSTVSVDRGSVGMIDHGTKVGNRYSQVVGSNVLDIDDISRETTCDSTQDQEQQIKEVDPKLDDAAVCVVEAEVKEMHRRSSSYECVVQQSNDTVSVTDDTTVNTTTAAPTLTAVVPVITVLYSPGGSKIIHKALSENSESRLHQRCMELIRVVKDFAPELKTGKTKHELFVTIQDYSATDEDEFSVTEGDELLVHRQDDDGWWLASRIIDGKLGYLPSTFLKRIEDILKDQSNGVIVKNVDYKRVPEFSFLIA